MTFGRDSSNTHLSIVTRGGGAPETLMAEDCHFNVNMQPPLVVGLVVSQAYRMQHPEPVGCGPGCGTA